MPEHRFGPNLFLVGAARSATTTIDRLLRAHPDIYMSPIKEPNYWSTDFRPEDFGRFYRRNSLHDLDAYFARPDPLPEMQLDFVRRPEHYDRLFRGASGERWRGESSTYYLPSEVAAARIAEACPDARILICLRDPVERAFSHYVLALGDGSVAGGFEEELAAEAERERTGARRERQFFLEFGRYGKQVQRYYDAFPAEHIHVMLFEDLVADQQATIAGAFAFLGVSTQASLPESVRENAALGPRLPRLNSVLRRAGLARLARRWIPEAWGRQARSALSTRRPALRPDTRARLATLYRQDVDRVERITGLSLDHWKGKDDGADAAPPAAGMIR